MLPDMALPGKFEEQMMFFFNIVPLFDPTAHNIILMGMIMSSIKHADGPIFTCHQRCGQTVPLLVNETIFGPVSKI